MTMLTARGVRRTWRRQRRRGHLIPIAIAATIAAGAAGLVGYLLWPTFQDNGATAPLRIPVSIGGTVFNVPDRAFRIKVQKHSGPQERVDLSYDYPSLLPPGQRRHVSADEVEDGLQPIDRIFVSIATHGAALAPDIRINTVYPRYLAQPVPAQDGLTMRPFREPSPYAGEDLYVAGAPPLVARCTRDTVTPGMCISERRIEGADMTFRFPRQWLAQWRDVAGAMDQLAAQLHSPRG